MKKRVININADEKYINTNGNTLSEHPIFCFKSLRKECLKNCKEKQLKDFIERLQQLGQLGWKEINTSDRHGFGYEKISVSQLKIRLEDDIKFVLAFRYSGKLPFIGVRMNNNVFQILAIEANFGELYEH